MNTEKLLKLQAHLDGELSAQESRQVSEWLANDAEAQAVSQELREAKALLMGNERPAKVPESREFYWSKIEREILRSDAAADRKASTVLSRGLWRFAISFGSAAALIILALLLIKPLMQSGSLVSYFQEIETPIEEANAISFHSQAAGMTVVWIDSGSN